jgi:hypothetical protein
MIHVILRTCHKSLLALPKPRICGNDRGEMILKCLHSLIISCNYSKLNLKLTILDDHSDPKFVEQLKEKLLMLNSPSEFISLVEVGFNNSAYEQFFMAAQNDDLVYTVEDDYLHTEDAILEMYNAYEDFKTNISPFKEVAIHPYDCVDRYDRKRFHHPCKLYYRNNRYWRTTNHSSNTIFMQGSMFRKYFDIFKHLALNYGKDPNVAEDQTINRLWNNNVTAEGVITMFSPIPSLAVHLSYDEPTKLTTVMNDWREQWNENKL